jgi:hypothetical protein
MDDTIRPQQPHIGDPQTTARGLSCKARPPGTLLLTWGLSPLCESYRTKEQLNQMEPFYPLHVKVCDQCFLVQFEQYVSAEHK